MELSSLAEIGDGVGPNAVNRENARRRIVIRSNTQDRDLADIEEVGVERGQGAVVDVVHEDRDRQFQRPYYQDGGNLPAGGNYSESDIRRAMQQQGFPSR